MIHNFARQHVNNTFEGTVTKVDNFAMSLTRGYHLLQLMSKFLAGIPGGGGNPQKSEISIVLRIFFFGRGTLQDMCREWPTSRFAAV